MVSVSKPVSAGYLTLNFSAFDNLCYTHRWSYTLSSYAQVGYEGHCSPPRYAVTITDHLGNQYLGQAGCEDIQTALARSFNAMAAVVNAAKERADGTHHLAPGDAARVTT